MRESVLHDTKYFILFLTEFLFLLSSRTAAVYWKLDSFSSLCNHTQKETHEQRNYQNLTDIYCQESIRTKANRPLRDRNLNTYNLILKRTENDHDLEMTLTLMIILIL